MHEKGVFRPKDIRAIPEIATPNDFHNGVHNLVRRALSVYPEISPFPLLRRLRKGIKLNNVYGNYYKRLRVGSIHFAIGEFDLDSLPQELQTAIKTHIGGGLNRLNLSARYDSKYMMAREAFQSSTISLNKDGLYSPGGRSLDIHCTINTFSQNGHYTQAESLLLGSQLLQFANDLLDIKLQPSVTTPPVLSSRS